MRADERAAALWRLPLKETAALIMSGRVRLDGVPVGKPGDEVTPDAALTLLEKPKRFASRSGYKLEYALDTFGIDVAGRTVCDIGASNGGFTDCLLQRGAARVHAVDVAYGILAWELRQDARVHVLERCNARYLTADMIGETADMVTADVSFISLKKIFPAMTRVLRGSGEAVCLIKPQFEAARRELTKNGMLRDEAVLPGLFEELAAAAAQQGLVKTRLVRSPMEGSHGNIEYLMRLIKMSSEP